MSPDTEPRLVDNAAEHRYELWVGDERAGLIEYGIRPWVVELIHTEIDPAFEGRGLGTRLIAGALDDIRARGLELIPTCPFVRAYLRRNSATWSFVPPIDAADARAQESPRIQGGVGASTRGSREGTGANRSSSPSLQARQASLISSNVRSSPYCRSHSG